MQFVRKKCGPLKYTDSIFLFQCDTDAIKTIVVKYLVWTVLKIEVPFENIESLCMILIISRMFSKEFYSILTRIQEPKAFQINIELWRICYQKPSCSAIRKRAVFMIHFLDLWPFDDVVKRNKRNYISILIDEIYTASQ